MQVCGTRTASEATEKPLEAPGTGSWPQLDLKMALRVLWGSLGLLRLVWCLLPQTGYVHPDEFFQSPEVMAGKAPVCRWDKLQQSLGGCRLESQWEAGNHACVAEQ